MKTHISQSDMIQIFNLYITYLVLNLKSNKAIIKKLKLLSNYFLSIILKLTNH